MLAARPWAAELLRFWFGALDPSDWFAPDEAVDDALRARFERELFAVGATPPASFMRGRGTWRAAILLFDQVPRNLYRNTARAFAWDRKARVLARAAIAAGLHRDLPRAEAQFVAMPLMHSEAIADQRTSVAFFARYGDAQSFAFARAHHAMIARFDRFPHRNAVLGRDSGVAERRAVERGFDW